MPNVPELPNPASQRRVRVEQRPVVIAAVVGGGICLLAVIIGLVALGISDKDDAQIAQTGLASIGATLAGGFAGWIARGQAQQGASQSSTDNRRSTDPPQ
jgi:hypothetical protein